MNIPAPTTKTIKRIILRPSGWYVRDNQNFVHSITPDQAAVVFVECYQVRFDVELTGLRPKTKYVASK